MNHIVAGAIASTKDVCEARRRSSVTHGARYLLAGAFCAMSVLPATLFAQDEAPRRAELTADIGYVNTSGNTSVTSLNLGNKLILRAGAVLLTQTSAFVYGRTSGEETANNQALRVRADRPIGNRLAVYGFGGYDRNKFGGVARRFDQNVGLTYDVLQASRDSIGFEAGIGLVQESLYADEGGILRNANNYSAGRAAANYKHAFTETSYFQQTLEYLPDLEESSAYRLNSESSVVAPVSTHIGLKASALIRYNNAPPLPEFRKTDRLISAGLQLTF